MNRPESDIKEELLGRKKDMRHPAHILIQPRGHTKPHLIDEAEFERFFHIFYLSFPRASDYIDLEELFKEFPISYRIPFITKENRNLYEEYRKELHEAHIAPTSIRWISEAKGYGLFAEAPLLKGTFVGEYTGFYRRYFRRLGNKNSYCLMLPTRFFSHRIWMIDAWQGGNETRFVNHSERPNCALKCLIHDRLMRVALFTERDINQGEELTFHYGDSFWERRVLRKRE